MPETRHLILLHPFSDAQSEFGSDWLSELL